MRFESKAIDLHGAIDKAWEDLGKCKECNGVGYNLIADKHGDIVNAEPCGCEEGEE